MTIIGYKAQGDVEVFSYFAFRVVFEYNLYQFSWVGISKYSETPKN
jgi:hypothetical protein